MYFSLMRTITRIFECGSITRIRRWHNTPPAGAGSTRTGFIALLFERTHIKGDTSLRAPPIVAQSSYLTLPATAMYRRFFIALSFCRTAGNRQSLVASVGVIRIRPATVSVWPFRHLSTDEAYMNEQMRQKLLHHMVGQGAIFPQCERSSEQCRNRE